MEEGRKEETFNVHGAQSGYGGVEHRFVHTNGIRMHFVEKGTGPTVLLLHGFPECWYSYRYQIKALADAGYHVVVPDLRGYGESDAPQGSSNYTSLHIVGDLIGLLDHLQQNKVFVVAHDWGGLIAWDLCLFRPDRVIAIASLGVTYSMRNPRGSFVSLYRQSMGDDVYISKWQEPGKAEAVFASASLSSVFKTLFITPHNVFSVTGNISFSEPETLPAWLTEEDIKFYSNLYEKTGFTGPLNYYRAVDLTWELKAPWAGKTIEVPALHIIGEQDIAFSFAGMKEYIHGNYAKAATNLQEIVVIEDAGHFVHQEKASVVNDLLINFLRKF